MNEKRFFLIRTLMILAVALFTFYVASTYLSKELGLIGLGTVALIGTGVTAFQYAKQCNIKPEMAADRPLGQTANNGGQPIPDAPRKIDKKTEKQLKYEKITQQINEMKHQTTPRYDEQEVERILQEGESRDKGTSQDMLPTREELLHSAMIDRLIKDLNSGYFHVVPSQDAIRKFGKKGFAVKFEKTDSENDGATQAEPETALDVMDRPKISRSRD